jgi:hypothetical protein
MFFALGPANDKQRIKHRIALSVDEQIYNLDDAELPAAAKDKYEWRLVNIEFK